MRAISDDYINNEVSHTGGEDEKYCILDLCSAEIT